MKHRGPLGLVTMANNELFSKLLPVLSRSREVGFNVFDVMHHGTHEKQLSNVFRWILDIGGTHNFAGLGQRVFVESVNLAREEDSALPLEPYTVRQEVNTSSAGENGDIADIVLESDSAVIVIENYGTSDGHGHGYKRYLAFSERDKKTGAVILLCAEEDAALQTHGWENATVVTYERILDRLIPELDRDPAYANENGEQYAFISQLHRKYANGRGRMNDSSVLDFVTAMCVTGEAKRYQEKNQEIAAERFANDIAQQARERMGEGRDVLQRVKNRLRTFSSSVLIKQLNATLGSDFITKEKANWSGIYQWTINFETVGTHDSFGAGRFQIKFGPSAWYANEQDAGWKQTVAPEAADYSRLFLTRSVDHTIRQSSVSLQEVLDGLSLDDTRLHDELIALNNGL